MNRNHLIYLLLFSGAFLNISCGFNKKISFIKPDSGKIQYEGRVGTNNPGVAEIYWPGSSCKIKFKGTELKAILKDEKGYNYFNVIIDEDSIYVLKPDTVKTAYTLASRLPEGEHTVQLFKRTGGMTRFYGFELAPRSKIVDQPAKTRMIEFYGNSITVGSGVYQGDSPYGDENNYLSYAAITARHFDAKYSCIARSGIGLMVSWFPLIMPEMYDRLNPNDSTSKWDFSKATPGIVVINLCQNDFSLFNLPDHPQFKSRFGNKAPAEDFIIASYSRFVQSIRNHYPEAHIICVLGNMDAVKPGSSWPGYIEKAVASLHDKKVYTHFFPYKNTPDHPNEAEQKQMAESLVRFIDEHINW
ncbi:MAG: SGNH/GDSL hydrolase family protein [Ferruginibacter sp.]